MAGLSKNWLTEKHIDFEYKKYLLLGYLQEVNRQFNASKLYPWFAELIGHYRNTIAVKDNKELLQKNFPQRLSGIDTTNVKLTYENFISDNGLMQELESIIDYAIPHMEQYVEEGKIIYDFIEDHICLQSVGIVPINTKYGYMFLKDGHEHYTKVYEYQISFFESSSENFKAIHTQFVKTFDNTISTTFQSIKNDLIRENKQLPNPAAYAIETEMALPLEETFLPIAKRMLIRHISSAENLKENK